MTENNRGQSRRAVLPPKIERVDDLGKAKPDAVRSSTWTTNVCPARLGVHDYSAVAADVRCKIQVFKPPIQRQILIKKHLTEYVRTYEHVLAFPVIVVGMLSHVVL